MDLFSFYEMNAEPLITTDGFRPYARVIKRLFGCSFVYVQVIKSRRKDKVIRVDRKLVIGSRQRLDSALKRSEGSSTLNTSFIEQHNLTIRRESAYLHRLTLSHARRSEYLKAHLELLQCHYNFIRPHSALKYGNEIWTPAMQAGFTTKRLKFRQVFLAAIVSSIFVSILYLKRSQNVKIQLLITCVNNS